MTSFEVKLRKHYTCGQHPLREGDLHWLLVPLGSSHSMFFHRVTGGAPKVLQQPNRWQVVSATLGTKRLLY